ncbi:radical SAM protein [Candidatus Sumerlaeota bacterium]|nr:radical SAM protein [Candidatus Sumerlaeota bacterium]
MRFLVLNPSSAFTKNVVRDVLYGCWCKGKRIGGASVPPYALLGVATVLKRAGLDVEFLDALGERVPLTRVVARASEFDVVVMSTSTMSVNEDAETLRSMKGVNASLQTFLFGSHPTFLPEATLAKEGVDVVVRREPEYVVRDVALALDRGEDWRGVPGIGYREDGRTILNPDYPFIENLDDLPFLDVDMLPRGVHYFNPVVRRMPYMTLSTSRGCPGLCSFCTAPFFYGPRLRARSVDNVIAELAQLSAKGYREIFFRDETFTFSRSRTQEFCRKLIESHLDLTWVCNARVNTLDLETLETMKRSGCHMVKFGVESGVQEILDRSRKGTRIEQTREVFGWARQAGVETHAHVMLGMPGETEETIETTVRFVLEIDPTTVTFGLCTPYPGTPLFDEVAARHPEIGDGSATDLANLHVGALYNEHYTHVSSEYLEKAVRRAYRRFYLRPRYFWRTLRRVRTFDDVKRFTLAGVQVLDFSARGE